MSEQRLTQSERRAKTSAAVLASACRLFGSRGYLATSLDDIASDCSLTTRPIYHYFGNKKALFTAVNAHMEQRIVDIINSVQAEPDPWRAWSQFLELCEDPGFRQIVLVDSPNILGRDRWHHSAVVQALLRPQGERNAEAQIAPSGAHFRRELQLRMLISALTEAAMMVAEAEDVGQARLIAEQVVRKILPVGPQ